MSSPKEKAKELVHRYDLLQTYVEGFGLDDAKQCALIAIDEIISYCCADDVSFLYKVKEEINKL